MERKEKAKFHHDLIELLTEGKDDANFYERMVYALQIIANELTYYEKDIDK